MKTPTVYLAHKPNEVIAIDPIKPSSAMCELADPWSSEGRPWKIYETWASMGGNGKG
jgi:hypothetical protein